ncbi:unnamed protein product [Effrenium voratum]|nr:unnamed protein product [Effrenium voratum]
MAQQNGATAQRRSGAAAQPRNGVTAQRCKRATAQQRSGATAQRRNGATAQRRSGAAAQGRSGARAQRRSSATAQERNRERRSSATAQRLSGATAQRCSDATAQQRNGAAAQRRSGARQRRRLQRRNSAAVQQKSSAAAQQQSGAKSSAQQRAAQQRNSAKQLSDIALFNDIPESLRILLHEELYREVFLDSHFLSGIQDADDLHQICKRFCHFCFSEQVTAAKLDVFVDGTEAQHVYVSRTGDSIYWSILLDRNRQELRGTHWLCELALWAKWHHRGQLVANTTTRFVTIDPKSFATIAASEGGPIFAYLRTLGLLLIGQAEVTEEQSEDGVTDLTLGDELVRNLASRASGFAQFTEPSQRGKSIRLSHLGSLAGLRRSSSDYSSQSWI